MAGIYVHIPFCKKACSYCDFHFSTSLKKKTEFIQALLKEIVLRKDFFSEETISTIYFGGGTPSLLTTAELNLVFECLYNNFHIDSSAEITLEANPDDLTDDKINGLRNSPVNRLSIGVQSFRDEDLRFMNRAHYREQALESIKQAQDYGFENITIDLIYGVPGLSAQQWVDNLNIAFSLGVPHLSCYALTVEENTSLYHQIQQKKLQPISDEQTVLQFEILMSEMQKNGYEQYEISNFCKSNKYSKHNSSYWSKDAYLGLGPSAHSYMGTERMWNVSSNVKYIDSLRADKLPFEMEVLSASDCYNEYVMTSLRTKWGCSILHIEKEFSSTLAHHFKKEINKHLTKGLVKEESGIYFLSDAGKLHADGIASDLFSII